MANVNGGNKAAFIERVCREAGIRLVRVGRRFGWLRVFDSGPKEHGSIERGTLHRTEAEAFAAAHRHYGLRVA